VGNRTEKYQCCLLGSFWRRTGFEEEEQDFGRKWISGEEERMRETHTLEMQKEAETVLERG